MAVAALRNLVAKVRIPGAVALRASRAPVPRATLPSPPAPKADVENALLVKNKIESLEAKELFSSGELIADHCELTEQVINQMFERYAQVARSVVGVTAMYFCTGVTLGAAKHVVESYYYNKAEFEFEERLRLAEVDE